MVVQEISAVSHEMTGPLLDCALQTTLMPVRSLQATLEVPLSSARHQRRRFGSPVYQLPGSLCSAKAFVRQRRKLFVLCRRLNGQGFVP